MIELKNVYKEYKSKNGIITKALNNININLPNKGMIFILGKSGSGKSTLLNIIGCMDKVTNGEIFINDILISNLSESKLNNYRNSCFGFIFQEHNLIEKLTVYDNLKLSSTLKRLKNKKDDYDKCLSLVSLDNLGDRCVNELSGGQKTRVAIARALIKDPNIILADEPTGSLDASNSIQVFDILKNISKERLVIVVTHDIEYAYKYGDRVISIEDGNIVKDEIINNIIDENSEIKIIKSKLPFLSTLKFSMLNLKGKILRMITVSIIVSITLTLFGYSYLMSNIDVIKTHVSAMVDNNETKMYLTKKIPGQNLTSIHPALSINRDEIDSIKKNITSNVEESFKLVVNNNFLNIAENDDYENKDFDILSNAYYNYSYSDMTFILKSNDEINKLKLIGSKPVNNNDVVIHKVLADYLIARGVSILDTDSKGNLINKSWFPKSYEELVNSKNKVLLTNGRFLNSKKYYIVITGIIDEDMSKFDILKSIDNKKAEHEYSRIYKEFSSVYKSLINEIIVKDNFYTETDMDKNFEIEKSLYELIYTYNNKNYYPDYSSGLMFNDDVSIYDGDKTYKINKVNENEIALDMSIISYMNGSSKFYSEQLKKYTDEVNSNYEKKVKEREEKVNAELKKLIDDPTYVIKEYPEIKMPSDKELLDEFHKKYINEYGLVGKNIKLTINDRINKNNIKTYDLKVIGYILETTNSNGDNSLVNEEVIKPLLRENKETYKVILDEKDKNKIKTILEKYSTSENYNIETIYSKTINSLDKSVSKLKVLFKNISYGLVILSIVILTLYILMSVNSNKKDIGILRSLGTRISDIYKIYYLEGFIIGIISVILSSFMIYFGIPIINNYISSDLFYNVKPVVFNPYVLLYTIAIIFMVVTISSLIPLIKISKSKVIDIIYSK